MELNRRARIGVKWSGTILKQMALEGLRAELESMVLLVKQVTKQTRARIFRGETRTQDGILSLLEPSTEVIRKGRRCRACNYEPCRASVCERPSPRAEPPMR